jgi:hypothetical protein
VRTYNQNVAERGCNQDALPSLDQFMSPSLRALIEDRYWYPVERDTVLETMVLDPLFRSQPDIHLGLYSDHGIQHVRDVAKRVPHVGALLSPSAPTFVPGCAVLLTYLHDVGMGAPIPRKVHAQFAAQLPFTDEFSDVLDQIESQDSGGIASRVEAAAHEAPFEGATRREIIAEVLAFALCHSKTCIPASVLRSPDELCAALRHACCTPLDEQFEKIVGRTAASVGFGPCPAPTMRVGAFDWVIDEEPGHRRFLDEIVSAVRVVRIADALRQRGTTLRTSAGYEIVVDHLSGDAVVLLRNQVRTKMFLLSFESPLSVGEANIRTADLLDTLTVAFEFHRGSFADEQVQRSVAHCCAIAIDDIQEDVLGTIDNDASRIALHAPPDDPSFADLVRTFLLQRATSPNAHQGTHSLVDRIDVIAPSRTPTHPGQSNIAPIPAGDAISKADYEDVIAAVIMSGTNPVIAEADPNELFAFARRRRLNAGDVVISPGDTPDFVVFAMQDGLLVEPLGGYTPEMVAPWTAVGVTGVLRGHERNAVVRAVQPVDIVVMNADHYLSHWYRPYSTGELCDLLRPSERDDAQ